MITQLVVQACLLLTLSSQVQASESYWERKREEMVRDQIEARGVVDERVVVAMRKVPRHLFVPSSYRPYAYGDFPLPIGEDQTISQPYMVAIMTELLDLEEDDRVLEIGTGSGYQAAVLAELASEVYTIEIIPSLALRADSVLKDLGYSIEVKIGDGYLGWGEHAPFDAIIVTCAPPYIPQPLVDQLDEGGRLVVPVGEEGKVQTLTLIEKVAGDTLQRSITPCIFVPMRSGHIQEK